MPGTETKKQVPKNVNLSELINKLMDDGVHFKDMTPEQLKQLPHLFAMVSKRTSKRTRQDYFQIIFKINDKLKITRSLDENEYNVICLDFPKENKQQGDEFVIKVPVLPSQGKTTEEENYYRLQLGVGKTIYHNIFLNDTEKRLLEEYDHGLDFVYREKRIDKNAF
jgi:hypothetical protein